ncbi:MAG: ribosomal RNA small subunit methyltransferase A [Chitinophagaceae bacterium]|nr:ribosomal RNA small subunit methyltransferase A [Chitinophagaceae bacterium]
MLYAKKSLGQHFLKDENIAQKIVDEFFASGNLPAVLEIGPGRGVLTKYLLMRKGISYTGVELDQRMIPLLLQEFPQLEGHVYNEDILEFDLNRSGKEEWSIIGNFPYNISSQILFKVLEHKERIIFLVGMFQKEVARRVAASSGNKEYGILSVLIQAYYSVEYLFDVDAHCFTPPPKVTSGVIRLIRKSEVPLIHDAGHFKILVKSGFGQRRKTLRNSLHQHIMHLAFTGDPVFNKRAEQLSVEEWIALSNRIVSNAS